MRPLSARDIVQAWEWGEDKHPVDRALLLLSLAQRELAPAEVAGLTVGQRNARLLALRKQTIGSTLHGSTCCPACRDVLEFSLDTDVLRRPEPDGSPFTLNAAGVDISFRLPTSLDLADIIGLSDVHAARHRLLARCVLHVQQDRDELPLENLPEIVQRAVVEAMSEADPQADMRFAMTCAECGQTWSALFDIVVFFWIEIVALAKRIMQDAHTLARAYGWREADILAMSSVRRAYYLELVSA